MPGHRLDAQEICGLHHVGAVHRIGEARTLQEIAAVEQQRFAGAGLGTQPIDQRLQMGEAAEPAIAMRGFGEVEVSEGVRQPALGRHAEMLEERLAHQMRRLAGHGADAEIDARLAEIDRFELRMRIGHVQHAGMAEAADVVEIVGAGGPRQAGNGA